MCLLHQLMLLHCHHWLFSVMVTDYLPLFHILLNYSLNLLYVTEPSAVSALVRSALKFANPLFTFACNILQEFLDF